MLVSKNAKICVTPNTKHKICVTPNAKRQWYIGCVVYRLQNFRVGHLDFMVFVLILFALATQREPSLQWNMGFRLQPQTMPTYWYPKRGQKASWTPTKNPTRVQTWWNMVTLVSIRVGFALGSRWACHLRYLHHEKMSKY